MGTDGFNPVTVKGYKGSKTDSTAYTGQIAKQLQHNSLKKIVSKGNPNDPSSNTLNKMMNYFENKDKAKTMAILDPKSSSKFPVKQKIVGEISTGQTLAGKADKGQWPNNMTGADVIRFMIKKASKISGGVDMRNGMNYPQLISKYAMGAVLYHQACDNYLDEKMTASNKP